MTQQGFVEKTWENEEGEEITVSFPSVNEVCDDCDGYGTYLNRNIGEHAYTPEEFMESFDDEERQEYFKRGGRYDVQCETCHGNKVIEVVDESHLTPEQKKLYEEYSEVEERRARLDAEDRAYSRMERMMERGYDG